MNDCTVLLFEDGVPPCLQSLGNMVQICLEIGDSEPLTFENGRWMGETHVGVNACILEREELAALGHPENALAVVRTGLEDLWLGALAGAVREAQNFTQLAHEAGDDHTTDTCNDCERMYPGWNEVVALTNAG